MPDSHESPAEAGTETGDDQQVGHVGREYLTIFLKGMCMGTADMVPGVSGGTIALIAGIYDRLVGALAAIDPGVLRHALQPHDPEARAALVAAWRRMDLTFLVALGLGVGTAVVLVTQVLTIALETYRQWTAAFFLGLIAASAVIIGRHVPWTGVRAGIGIACATLATVVAALTVPTAAPSTWLVFVAGAVAISAMVLPGLSGALLLIILGQYQYLLAQLDAFLNAIGGVATGDGAAALVEPGIVVATFMSGAVVGLLTVARAVDYALDRARATTMAALVGLMAGGLYAPAEIAVEETTFTPATGVALVGMALAGVVVVVAFDRATDDLEYV